MITIGMWETVIFMRGCNTENRVFRGQSILLPELLIGSFLRMKAVDATVNRLADLNRSDG